MLILNVGALAPPLNPMPNVQVTTGDAYEHDHPAPVNETYPSIDGLRVSVTTMDPATAVVPPAALLTLIVDIIGDPKAIKPGDLFFVIEISRPAGVTETFLEATSLDEFTSVGLPGFEETVAVSV